MGKLPLVSIVMPAYNSAGFITESIDSVRQQTCEDWELIVVDDASRDSTCQLVEGIMRHDTRIRLHKLPANQGAGFSRNIGIKASEGRYIAFLDADDLWKPHKLATQLEFMAKNKAAVCYSSYELMNEQGKSLQRMVRALETLSFRKLLRANYIGNLTGIYDAEKLGKIYCPLIRKRQDWGLWLLAVRKAGGAKGVTESLARYRLRKNSISGNKWEMLQYNFKVYRKVLGFSSLESSFWILQFLFEQFLVKSRQNVPLKQ